ncbi:I78 family peptidase inhibitor [Pantoea eucrina]|uniref:I78 family peptidase inhibitor n=1 Tax=Pantoea eucrina TaxID=472693 RepID=A0ABU5LH76_9GAMM|nr:I78 family peptidase inhibitor [Pantoea eucrina]MDZ7279285.1 I78 family peptidase inhibitor [Pantoea eucrina]
MKYSGKALLTAAVLTLAACQSASKPDDHASVTADNDRCHASAYQGYIGKPLTSLENQRFQGVVRAIPWNGAVTMDFNLHRLNFLADKDGKIAQVYCG